MSMNIGTCTDYPHSKICISHKRPHTLSYAVNSTGDEREYQGKEHSEMAGEAIAIIFVVEENI
jgi:hypothetical protein